MNLTSTQRQKASLILWKERWGGDILHLIHSVSISPSHPANFTVFKLSTNTLLCTGCCPFTDRGDPFLIETCPHAYFVGKQDKYDTRLVKGTLYLHREIDWLYKNILAYLFLEVKQCFECLQGQKVSLYCILKFSETGVAVPVSWWNVNLRNL